MITDPGPQAADCVLRLVGDRFPYLTDGGGQRGFGVSDLYAVVPLLQHVIDRLDHLCRCGNAQFVVIDRNGIAQIDPLQHGQIPVILGLPQRYKLDGDIHVWDSDVVVLDVFFRPRPQLVFRRYFFKIRRKINHAGPSVRIIVRICAPNRIFRQRDDLAGLVARPERAHTGDRSLDIFLLLQIRQIFSVADHDAGIGAPVQVQLDRPQVKFVLPFSEHVGDGILLPVQNRPELLRVKQRERPVHLFVRPDLKGTVLGRMLDHLIQRVGTAGGRERHDRYMVQLIADMFRVYGTFTVQRLGDFVDSEWLTRLPVRRYCPDDPAVRDVRKMAPINRILHLQLIGAVALLRHLACDRVGQPAQAIGGKCGLAGVV